MARRSDSIQRLIDDADQSISLLASFDGLADAPPSTEPRHSSTLVPPFSTGFSVSTGSASSDSFDFASSASSATPILSSASSATPILSAGRAVAPGYTSNAHQPQHLYSDAIVDRSVRTGLLHVRGTFPDHSVEYVDIDSRFASVGELKRALCAQRQPERDLGFSAADARVMFDSQLVEDDWLVADCGMGFDGTIHIVNARTSTTTNSSSFLSTSAFRATGGYTNDPKLATTSIASAYRTNDAAASSARGSAASSATLAQQTLAVRAEALARHVRPEESEFATLASDFYDHELRAPDAIALRAQLLGGYIDVLQTRLEHLTSNSSDRVADEVRELQDERNTWRLLFELLPIYHRDDNDDDDAMRGDTAAASMELHFDLLEDDAAQLLVHRNDCVRTQRAVRTWLESMAREHTIELHARSSTRNGNTTQKATGSARTLQLLRKGLLHTDVDNVELDPDAVLRRGDDAVVHDDAEDDAALLQSVWRFVRAGQLHDAIDLCVRLGQPWRAASLSGGTLVGAATTTDADGALVRWGNPLRALWKTTCWQFAEHASSATAPTLSKASSIVARQYEAIVFAALSGHVAVVTQSPLCETWEDHVWAYVTAMLEQQQDELLVELLRVKRQSSQLVVGATAAHVRQYTALLAKTQYLKRYSGDLDALFDELQHSSVARVRAQANAPHRRIQAKLVTRNVASIVATILEPLLLPSTTADSDYNWDLQLRTTLPSDDALSPLFVRFAAHFVLFAAAARESFDVHVGHMVLKLYIRHLVQHRQLQLVPVYVTQLPPAGAVEIYVQVLAAVDDRLERELVVKRILSYANMDVLATVLPIAVDRILDDARTHVMAARDAGNNVAEAALDNKRMRALEYLCLFPEHRAEALHRANHLAQQFVREQKVRAIATLFATHVPEDSLAVLAQHRSIQTRDAREIDRSVREALCWQSYIAATSAYDAWRSCVSDGAAVTHADSSSSSRSVLYSDEKDFVTELMYHASRAVSSLMDALHFEHGWMRACLDSGDDEAAVRQQCLPLLVFHLHYVQIESARVLLRLQHYPLDARVTLARPLLEQSLEVADVVADEHYGVYHALSQSECRDLLHGFRESAIALVHTESSVPEASKAS